MYKRKQAISQKVSNDIKLTKINVNLFEGIEACKDDDKDHFLSP